MYKIHIHTDTYAPTRTISARFISNQYPRTLHYVSKKHTNFQLPVWNTEKLIKSKPTWKPKHTNSILEYFEYFCQMSSKSILIVLSYTIWKLVHLLRHCIVLVTVSIKIVIIYITKRSTAQTAYNWLNTLIADSVPRSQLVHMAQSHWNTYYQCNKISTFVTIHQHSR